MNDFEDNKKNNSEKILEIEKSAYKIGFFTGWLNQIVYIFFLPIIIGVIIFFIKNGLPFKFVMLIAPLLLFMVIGGIYRMWAYSISLNKKVNVSVRWIEIPMFILLTAFLGTLSYLFIIVSAPLYFRVIALTIIIGSYLGIAQVYRKKTSQPVNPASISKINVDDDENIEFSVAGIARIGTFLDKGFNQNFFFLTGSFGQTVESNSSKRFFS